MFAAKNKVLWSVLGVSLVLNVFAGGFIAAKMMRSPQNAEIKREWRLERFSLFASMGRLSPGVREKVRMAVHENDPVIRMAEEKLKAARTAVRDAVRAEFFDREALEGAYEGLRSASLDFQKVVQGVAVGVISELSLDERKDLALKHKHRVGNKNNSNGGEKDR